MDNGKVIKSKARHNLNWVAAHLCVFTLLTSLAIAQRTIGTLSGQVLDPQGATVPNARISVTDQETGVVSNTVTSSAGTWNVPSLIPGRYSVSIQAQGFRTLLRRDVVVLADHENAANVQLQMGGASEVVEVVGSAVEVDTSSSSLNNDFSSQDVQNLPNAAGGSKRQSAESGGFGAERRSSAGGSHGSRRWRAAFCVSGPCKSG
jgi:hypothetical protein